MAIDFSKAKTFSNGVSVINATPHWIIFRDGLEDFTVESCGALINARVTEEQIGLQGQAHLVRTVFEQLLEGVEELEEIERNLPGVLIVGSLISAQAYPGRVVAMTPALGFERVPTSEKRASTSKFTMFPVQPS